MKNVYVGDFETTTDKDDCRVWGYGLYDLESDKTTFGNNLSSFMNRVFKLPTGSKIYFHNLRFDGDFILYWLFRNGFCFTENRKLEHKEFTTLITDRGIFYSLEIKHGSKKYKILDSLKLIPFGVEKIADAFDTPMKKGSIDYKKYRPLNYKITDDEKDYIRNDVEIVGNALKFFFNQSLNKMTQAGNAFYDFRNTLDEKQYKRYFPQLTIDKELRDSYKGGWTYCNPIYQGKDIQDGIVLDVNSLYPSVMYSSLLPYGTPKKYTGKYKHDKIYRLYIQYIRCSFELKENMLPIIQLKQTLGFMPTEYVKTSNGDEVVLCLTSVDLELFLEHYETFNLDYIEGWKFKASDNIFKTYIDKWIEVKNQASVDGNEGLRTLAKLMLNALYGRFALNPKVRSKYPVFDGELVKLVKEKNYSMRDPVYVAIASFITAYARKYTIDSAQANIERFIYADTDSLHLLGHELPNLPIDKVKLGAWKIEYKFKRGRFIRAKAYIEELEDDTTHIACAGLPHRCHTYINFDNFKRGLKVPKNYIINDIEYTGKLQHKRVKGGVILEEKEYTLKM